MADAPTSSPNKGADLLLNNDAIRLNSFPKLVYRESSWFRPIVTANTLYVGNASSKLQFLIYLPVFKAPVVVTIQHKTLSKA